MIEVPGMTRPALDAMSPQDVEATRWSLYARVHAPDVRRDYDAILQDITDADDPPTANVLKRRRAVLREDVAQSKAYQREVRAELFLDDETD
jgi:hypothetical protein